ncbi:MAG: HAD-IA family hydrolase [Pseudomonadales bacterium]|jgi:pseudouridine-5'-monophosphatase|tara:strand:+ start:5545 stop:6195 length:651 start_codon:yes stop_codon:yes gene_type:complete
MTTLPIDPAAIVFDLDGTLLDTEPLYTDAAQKVLDPHGHTYTMELKRKVMGGDSIRSAQLTVDEFDLPMTADEFLTARESYLKALFPEAKEIPGAGDYLRHLYSVNIPTGIATSSHRHLCDLKISHRDWRAVFNEIVCGDDTELHKSKPEPDIFLLCARRMGIKAEDIVAFEDSRNGVLSAKAAGMTVVAIESPYTSPEDLQEADLVIESYYALLN